MNIFFRLISVLIFLLLVNISYAHDEQKELVGLLREKGVTYLNTSKVVIYGSQADFGTDTKVVGEWTWLIQEIWDKIYQSRPLNNWTTSNYLRVEFYTDDNKVKAVFYVNETDNCFLSEKDKNGYRCPGIYSYLIKLLRLEHEGK